MLERLVDDFGFKLKTAQDFINTYPADYISDNLDTVDKAVTRGKVKNKTAYAAKALRTDYRSKANQDKHTKKSKQNEDKEIAEQRQNLYESEKQRVIENALAELGEETIFSDFKEHVIELTKSKPIYQRNVVVPDEELTTYLQNRGNRALFNVFMLDNYIAPHYASFEAWQKANRGL